MSTGVNGETRWVYKAATADGTPVRGEIAATTERDAIDALRRRALWVVELTAMSGPARDIGSTSPGGAPHAVQLEGRTSAAEPGAVGPRLTGLWRRVSGAADAELAVTVRAVATLLSAGVPLSRALAYAAQEGASDALRSGFLRLRDAVVRGDSLSAAVANHVAFPPIFAPLIAAGEHSGTLDESLALLASHLERRDELRARIRGALIYPMLLAVASIIGVTVILVVVVPRFAALISDSGGVLPLSTRTLIAVSTVITKGWWAIALAGGGLALGMERWLKRPDARQQLDRWRLQWPVVGHFERTQAAAGYTGTLAVGLRAGVSLLGSMALARGVVTNRYLAAGLTEAESRVRSGQSLSVAIAGLLPPLTSRLINAGEASGDLAGMAARAAESADVQLQRSLAQLVALIEPVMILGFGGVVGFVALALLQAIYGLNGSVL